MPWCPTQGSDTTEAAVMRSSLSGFLVQSLNPESPSPPSPAATFELPEGSPASQEALLTCEAVVAGPNMHTSLPAVGVRSGVQVFPQNRFSLSLVSEPHLLLYNLSRSNLQHLDFVSTYFDTPRLSVAPLVLTEFSLLFDLLCMCNILCCPSVAAECIRFVAITSESYPSAWLN